MGGKWVVDLVKVGPRVARTQLVPVRQGAAAHRPKDPAKECLKRRLTNAVDILRRLLAEKASGADMRQMLAKLDARTFAERLADFADGRSGRSRRVSDMEIDRMTEVMGWLDGVDDMHLLLDWSRGVLWADLVARFGASQKTLWRRIDRALDYILCRLYENAP